MNEPDYLVDSTKNFSQTTLVDLTKLFGRIYFLVEYYGWCTNLIKSWFNNSFLGGCRFKIFFSVYQKLVRMNFLGETLTVLGFASERNTEFGRESWSVHDPEIYYLHILGPYVILIDFQISSNKILHPVFQCLDE